MPTLNPRNVKTRAPRDARRLRMRGDKLKTAEIDDLRHEMKYRKRELLDMLRVENAAKSIQKLPDEDHSLHIVMRGNFAFGDIIPATLKLIEPETLVYLAITTLWFSRSTITQFVKMLDAKQIGTVDFLCTDLYAKTRPEETRSMNTALANRGSRFAAVRCHAKIVLMQTTDGRYYVSEGSANIRACRSVEQFAMFQDRDLFEFHQKWIQDMIVQYNPPKAE